MKIKTLFIATLLLVINTIMAYAQRTAYAVFCAGSDTGNDVPTLYFLSSETTPTNTHNGQTITEVWSGTTVTNSGIGYSTPAWHETVREALRRVVFETSFREVRPLTCCNWFYRCSQLAIIDNMENLNTSSVTNMGGYVLRLQ